MLNFLVNPENANALGGACVSGTACEGEGSAGEEFTPRQLTAVGVMRIRRFRPGLLSLRTMECRISLSDRQRLIPRV